ncbi:MAG: SDR family oxidoreductase, partial [Spirochaetales bacterium]|nr:SDR family oxidoreductase [Spirochaetales bacterium]
MWNLEGKIAIVTGAARGIGRGIAENLAGNGCTLIVADVRGDAAERCAAEIRTDGHRATALTLDVTDGEAVQIAFASMEETYGRIDILVNNAGILHDAPIVGIDEERWDVVIDTNLKGIFLCARAVVPGMVRRGWGRIINVSSVGGKDGFSLAGVHYAASKAGM